MKRLTTLFVASLLLALAVTQSAATKNPRGHHHRGHHQQHAVFVQTNEPAGNRIIVFDRARNGQLSQAGTYPTGGNGGVAAPGDEPDHLASQGSLVYDWRHSLLIAVNANRDNALVRFVLDTANTLDLGIFSRSNGIKHFTGSNADVKNALLNWGLGAVAWLVLGRILERMLRP